MVSATTPPPTSRRRRHARRRDRGRDSDAAAARRQQTLTQGEWVARVPAEEGGEAVELAPDSEADSDVDAVRAPVVGRVVALQTQTLTQGGWVRARSGSGSSGSSGSSGRGGGGEVRRGLLSDSQLLGDSLEADDGREPPEAPMWDSQVVDVVDEEEADVKLEDDEGGPDAATG